MADSSSSGSDYDPNHGPSGSELLSSDDSDSLSDDSSDMDGFIDDGRSEEEEGGAARKKTRSKYIDDGAKEDNSLNGTRDARPLAPLPGHREPHNSIGDSARDMWGTILAWTATFAVSPDVFAKAAEDRCVNPVNAAERREAAAFAEIHNMYELAECVAALTGGTRLPLIITELKLAGCVALRKATAADLTAFPDGPTCFLTGACLTPNNARILTMQPSAAKLEVTHVLLKRVLFKHCVASGGGQPGRRRTPGGAAHPRRRRRRRRPHLPVPVDGRRSRYHGRGRGAHGHLQTEARQRHAGHLPVGAGHQ